MEESMRRARRSNYVPGPVEGPWAGLAGWECRAMSAEVAKMLLKMEEELTGEGLRPGNLAARTQRAAVREEMILVTTEEAEKIDQARVRVLAKEKEAEEKGGLPLSPTKIKRKSKKTAGGAPGSPEAMAGEGLSSSSNSSSNSSSSKLPVIPLPPAEALVEERPVSKALMARMMAREAKARLLAAAAAAAAATTAAAAAAAAATAATAETAPAASAATAATAAAAAAAGVMTLPALSRGSLVGRVQAAYFKQMSVKVTAEEARQLDELAGEVAEMEEKERLKKERLQQQQQQQQQLQQQEEVVVVPVAVRKEREKEVLSMFRELGMEERMMADSSDDDDDDDDDKKEEGEGGREKQKKRGEELGRKRAASSSPVFGRASWEEGGGGSSSSSSSGSSNNSSNRDLSAAAAAKTSTPLLPSTPSLQPSPHTILAEDGGERVHVSRELYRALMTLDPNPGKMSFIAKVQSAVMSEKDTLHLPPSFPPSLGPAERVLLAQAQAMVKEGLFQPGMKGKRKKKAKLLTTGGATEEGGMEGGGGASGGAGGGKGAGEKGLFAVPLTREGIGAVQAWEAKVRERVTSASLSSRLMALFTRDVTVFRTDDEEEARKVEEAEREGEGKRQRRAAALAIQQQQQQQEEQVKG